jgi:hypothetical protein
MKFCDDCEYLSPTEKEQQHTPEAPPHMCTELNQRLMHGTCHPHIPSPSQCPLGECIICDKMNRRCICTPNMFDNIP